MSELTYAQKVVEISEVSDKICNDWECGFIENMMEKGSDFTDKQKDVIDKLYQKACESEY